MTGTIHTPDLKKIKITDRLFGHYVGLVAKTMLPVQWEKLNGRGEGAKSHCIDNFRIAAGEMQGAHQGVVFGDSDAYKWLEAVAYCANNGETEYIAEADELIALIGRAQQPDGYLNTYYTINHPEQRWQNLIEGHELYCAGHLFEAAVAYADATGKKKLLATACRFADLIYAVFGTGDGQRRGYPGHQVVELGLVKLWRLTGEKRYLDLAQYFITQRGTEPNYFLAEIAKREANGISGIFPEFADYDLSYSQSHQPPVEQVTAEGHAVRAMYMYSAMADLAGILGDGKLKDACRTLWNSVTQRRMYITGGIGSSGLLERFTVDYDLPNDRMYCESCASVGLVMFGQRMGALSRDASYYDTVERVLCNILLAGLSAEGDRYFYVNPLEVWPDNCKEHTSLHYVKSVRQPWFECACCPPNIARTLASLGQYIYAQDNKSLYVNLLISSDIETEIQGNCLKLSMVNELMSGGKLSLRICSAGKKSMTVRLRIPPWLEGCAFRLDGSEIHPAVENGYAVLAVTREGEQLLEVSGETPARFVAANLNVRADIGKLALAKGPFIYCLEEADNGANLAALRVDANAGICGTAGDVSLPGGLPILQADGERTVSTVDDDTALYSSPKRKAQPVKLTAVPYCLWGNREKGEMRVWIDAEF